MWFDFNKPNINTLVVVSVWVVLTLKDEICSGRTQTNPPPELSRFVWEASCVKINRVHPPQYIVFELADPRRSYGVGCFCCSSSGSDTHQSIYTNTFANAFGKHTNKASNGITGNWIKRMPPSKALWPLLVRMIWIEFNREKKHILAQLRSWRALIIVWRTKLFEYFQVLLFQSRVASTSGLSSTTTAWCNLSHWLENHRVFIELPSTMGSRRSVFL